MLETIDAKPTTVRNQLVHNEKNGHRREAGFRKWIPNEQIACLQLIMLKAVDYWPLVESPINGII